MLRVIAQPTRERDWLCDILVNEVPVTALAASVDKARSFEFANEVSYFRRHHVVLCTNALTPDRSRPTRSIRQPGLTRATGGCEPFRLFFTFLHPRSGPRPASIDGGRWFPRSPIAWLVEER